MKKNILFFGAILSLLFAACSDDPKSAEGLCGVRATVRDLTGTDGCGLVFQLNDGSYLEPLELVYCCAPSPSDDPLYYFELVDGKKVTIGYEETNAMSVCMVGKIVRITCISELPLPIVD